MKKYKGYIATFIAGALFATAGSAFAEDGLTKIEAYLRTNLNITLNGQPVKLESPAVMVDGNTYLKLRDAAKLTGVDVNWNEQTQTVELGSGQAATKPQEQPQAAPVEVAPQRPAGQPPETHLPTMNQQEVNNPSVKLKMGETYDNGKVRIRFYDLVKTPATEKEKAENKFVDHASFKIDFEILDKQIKIPDHFFIYQNINSFNSYEQRAETSQNGMLIENFSADGLNTFEYKYTNHESQIYKSITNSILDFSVKDITWTLE